MATKSNEGNYPSKVKDENRIIERGGVGTYRLLEYKRSIKNMEAKYCPDASKKEKHTSILN